MRGLSVKIEDQHIRKTARGATAAPRGKQPILVQTECVSMAFRASALALGSSRLRSEQTFPKALRDATGGVTIEDFSFAGPLRAGGGGPSQAGRVRPAALGRPSRPPPGR